MWKNKICKCFLVLALLAVVVCFLTACSNQLSGTYTSEGLITQSLTFKPDNVLVISAFGIDAEGTYKIDGDKIIFTYKFFNESFDIKKDFKKKGNSIFIDGLEFVKEQS